MKKKPLPPDQGCHLAYKKAKSALFGLFWNSFLEIKWFGHLAFSWPFFNLEENSIFLSLFWLNFNKSNNILWYFKNFMIYFRKISLKIWPLFGLFHHLRIWPFLKLHGQIWSFLFFGTWQPCPRHQLFLVCISVREILVREKYFENIYASQQIEHIFLHNF